MGAFTLVGRDLAISNPQESWVTWRAAELMLHCIYAIFIVGALCALFLTSSDLPPQQVILCVVLFWALTIQNVGQAALFAKKKFALAGGIQIVGVLFRAALTLVALTYFGATLENFFLVQATAAAGQMLVTSRFCESILSFKGLERDTRVVRRRLSDLLWRGRPLVLLGISGAAVLQLDKVIIPLFLSTAELTPYFLASALCFTPISVLAGPINQYFFPGIVNSINQKKSEETLQKLKQLILAIFLGVAVPSAILWLGRDAIVNAWLHHQPVAAEVVKYVEVLLPGVALGALGYVPYNILIALEDYKMQAFMSASITLATLSATVLAASSGNVLAICWIYALYHSLSAVASWVRASYLIEASATNYAVRSAHFASMLLLVTTAMSIIFFMLHLRF
jgi:O-antigen/teichoic acid export membrane protein